MACRLLAVAASVSLFSPAEAQGRAKPRSPLAFVRRIVVPVVVLATPPDAPLTAPPAPPDKRRQTEWEARKRARTELAALRGQALTLVHDSITAELSRHEGLIVVTGTETATTALVPTPARWRGLPRPDPAAAETARAAGADAAVVIALDRFGVNTGIERELWIRTAAYVVMAAEGEVRGPWYALGRARSGRKFFGFGRGFDRTDSELMHAAASQAAHHLATTLSTGVEIPFARNRRVAIVPAIVPDTIAMSQPSNSMAPNRVRVPALERQSDVLFQPDVGPAAEIIDQADVAAMLRDLDIEPESMWQKSLPVIASVAEIAERLEADYVFLSRVTNSEMAVGPVDEQQTSEVAKRCDLEVEGALYSTAAGRIVWRDRAEGGTVAITGHVRHQPRIRTDEQCVLDAARTAYAHLRFAFDSYMRRFDR